jgi:hypothetical protein
MLQRSRLSRAALFSAAAIAILFALATLCSAQELARRLILKDGSYQLVTKYETKGDRIRYYSAERQDWEELPASLVDWPATEKYEKDRASSASVPEAVQLDKEIEHESEMHEATLPQVAPGLRIPEDSGVFLFDSFEGEPQLVELQQTVADVNRNTKGNILRGAINPIAGLKQTIELEGAHATIQSHVGVPSLYIKPETDPDHPDSSKTSAAKSGRTKTAGSGAANAPEGPEQAEQPEQAVVPFDRFIIVRSEVKGNKRIVGAVKRSVTGKVAQEQHAVKTTIDRVNGGWLKITSTEPLAAGEYALIEIMGTEGMNLYVWDFGVNPKAAANANPWKPEKKAAGAPEKKQENTTDK